MNFFYIEWSHTMEFEVLTMEHITNIISLRGMLKTLPEFSHENHSKKFYRFLLEIPRLSGTVDVLPVIAEKQLLSVLDPTAGDMIFISGQIRSHNQREEGIRRLLIYVFATSICVENGEPENKVFLEGPLCREPTFRRTPLGREICDAMLAVPRAFHRADYLPCILWGKIAQEISGCHTRDVISVEGRLQSRVYTKLTEEGPKERTAYEISALTAQIVEENMY